MNCGDRARARRAANARGRPGHVRRGQRDPSPATLRDLDALAGPPSDERAALILAYFEGRTHTEVAVLTGVSVSEVDTRLRNGQKQLRDLVNDR